MRKNPDLRRRSLIRALAGSGLALASSAAWLPLLSGCTSRPKRADEALPLLPTTDPTTGLDLLELPEGFRYFSFGWRGQAMDGGFSIPDHADGMAVVAEDGERVRLVRNHEIWAPGPVFAENVPSYDPAAGGGTVVLDVDLGRGLLLAARAGLVGTCANCSGGLLPGGRWLSCEEQVHVPGAATLGFAGESWDAFTRPHGYVFDGGPRANAEPLLAMGQMRHEGLVHDPATGFLYLTEDRPDAAGLYRFRPADPANLWAGGVLEMLALARPADLRRGVRTGQRMACRWVRIEQPDLGHQPGTNDQGGCVAQGLAGGGARFTRLEGITHRDGVIHFNSTDGGDAGAGQIFAYRPATEQLELVYESKSVAEMDYPDQMSADLGSGLLICQDSKRVEAQALWWLSPDGRLRTLARNHVEIGGRSYRDSEWSGVCMSADRRWLFANLYHPGFSVAITGPFERLAA